jgi:hypothetical protein
MLASVAGAIIVVLTQKAFLSNLGWRWILAAPLLLIASFAGALLLNLLLEGLEWLAFCLRKCPSCGGRKWSWGFTRGFGL